MEVPPISAVVDLVMIVDYSLWSKLTNEEIRSNTNDSTVNLILYFAINGSCFRVANGKNPYKVDSLFGHTYTCNKVSTGNIHQSTRMIQIANLTKSSNNKEL